MGHDQRRWPTGHNRSATDDGCQGVLLSPSGFTQRCLSHCIGAITWPERRPVQALGHLHALWAPPEAPPVLPRHRPPISRDGELGAVGRR